MDYVFGTACEHDNKGNVVHVMSHYSVPFKFLRVEHGVGGG